MNKIARNSHSPEAVFEAKFNAIETTASFNKHWHVTGGRITGLIVHPEFRLILEHGKFARCTDNFGRKIILLGTEYGLILFYQELAGTTRKQRIAYEVCPMLVEKGIYLKKEGTAGAHTLEIAFETGPLGILAQVANRAAEDRMNGYKVWDGIPKPEPKKRQIARRSMGKKNPQVNTKGPSLGQLVKAKVEEKAKEQSKCKNCGTCKCGTKAETFHDPATGIDYKQQGNKWVPEGGFKPGQAVIFGIDYAKGSEPESEVILMPLVDQQHIAAHHPV